MSIAPAHRPAADELMDRIYRRQRHFYDLTRKYFLLGRDHLIRELQPPAGGSVMEIGCGTGRNLIAAARAYPEARLFGLDISSAMLATARANIRQRRPGAAHHAGPRRRGALRRRSALRAAQLRPRVLLLQPLDDPALAGSARARDRRSRRRAGGCLSSISASRSACPRWFRRGLFTLARHHVTPRAELQAALAALAASAAGGSLPPALPRLCLVANRA